ncbi:hypothetical protein WUBG_00622 [Wuchereria bancrofti]|nr:hypothetical protein WUBG_00622 [Wuchereria bancrofti]
MCTATTNTPRLFTSRVCLHKPLSLVNCASSSVMMLCCSIIVCRRERLRCTCTAKFCAKYLLVSPNTHGKVAFAVLWYNRAACEQRVIHVNFLSKKLRIKIRIKQGIFVRQGFPC